MPDDDRLEPGPDPAPAPDGPPPGHAGRLQDGRVQGFEELVAAPLERLAQRNIRTPALLTRLLPWRWTMPDGSTRALADRLADAVPWWSTPLRDNGIGGPTVITGATEVAYGVDWTFACPSVEQPRGRVGDYRLGYAAPPPELRVADAIAASCAFPPYFEPMAFDGNVLRLAGGSHGSEDRGARRDPRPDPADRWRGLRQPRARAGLEGPRHRPGQRRRLGVPRGHRAHGLRPVAADHGDLQRWRHVGAPSVAARQLRPRRPVRGDVVVGHQGASAPIRLRRSSCSTPIRTDLDAFSQVERHVLERHGYLVADAAIHRHQPELVRVGGSAAPAAPGRGRPRGRRPGPPGLRVTDPARPLVRQAV